MGKRLLGSRGKHETAFAFSLRQAGEPRIVAAPQHGVAPACAIPMPNAFGYEKLL